MKNRYILIDFYLIKSEHFKNKFQLFKVYISRLQHVYKGKY